MAKVLKAVWTEEEKAEMMALRQEIYARDQAVFEEICEKKMEMLATTRNAVI